MATMLTDVVVRQAKAPKTGRLDLWDAKVKGLVLRVTAKGSRSWSVFYRFHGINRRLTLGEYRGEDGVGNGLTLGQARKAAGEALRDVSAGRDPQAVKVTEKRAQAAQARREGDTFAVLAERWLSKGKSRKGTEWRPKTRMEFARIVETELVPVLGPLDPEAVTKKQIRTLYDRIAVRSESMAKHALAILRLLYQWAADEDYVDAMPVFPKRGTQSHKRTRVLEEAELRAVVAALDSGIASHKIKEPVGDLMAEAFRMMLLTGQRRGEVLSMRWDNITEEKGSAWWTIPKERHKGGREHRVPLTAPAVEALKRIHKITGNGEWLFPSPRAGAKVPWVSNPQKASKRLWNKCKVKGATVHDLRRSCATYTVRLGVSRLVVGKVLGHADTDVTGRYDKYDYDSEKRGALERWAAELARIVTDKQEATEARVLPWVTR